jgi:predicted LPLAT superfamily acyltransferase
MSESGLRDSVLLVIPTYNNCDAIASVITQCLEVHPHILVVDDGSQDGAREIIDSVPGIKVLRHDKNAGKGAAIVAGLDYAKNHGFRFIITCDGDGQHYPTDIPKFIQAVRDQGKNDQLIIGSRNFKDADSGDVPGSSKFGRSFSNFWIALETGKKLADTQSGFRLYSVNPEIYKTVKTKRYDSEIDLLVRYAWAGARIGEVPIRVYYPDRNERVSHFHPFWDNLRLTILHTTLVFLNIMRLAGIYRPYAKRKAKETSFSFMIPLLLKVFGKSISFLIMPFPVLIFYLTSSAPRRGIGMLYERLKIAGGVFGWARPFANYWYFSASLVDRLALLTTPVFSSEDAVGKKFEPGSLYIGAHYGDWLLSAKRLSGKRGIKVGIIMDPSQTPKFHAAIEKLDLAQVTLIDGSLSGLELALTIKEFLDDGGGICLMGDRLLPDGKSLSINFLGADARFPAEPFQLASALKVPTYFYTSTRQARFAQASYAVICEKLWDGSGVLLPQELLARYVTLLEVQVRSYPQHWFNFYNFWEHRYGR